MTFNIKLQRHQEAGETRLKPRMCSVVGCDSWRRSAQRFKLPEDPESRLEWVQFLFEVNGQRLKESSWTDITICTEHFTDDCFIHVTPETGTVRLKFDAVPSLCIKSEPEEPLESPHVVSLPGRCAHHHLPTSSTPHRSVMTISWMCFLSNQSFTQAAHCDHMNT